GEIVRERDAAALALERQDDAVRERIDEHHHEIDGGREQRRGDSHAGTVSASAESGGRITTRSDGSLTPTALPTSRGRAARASTICRESSATSTSCSRPRYSIRRTVPRTTPGPAGSVVSSTSSGRTAATAAAPGTSAVTARPLSVRSLPRAWTTPPGSTRSTV